ncbi:Asp23/Gls24 family envelope stress response protein [Paenibacillus agricola]|uniref:Asp23/Gls24 family envelope stress response protein n=1 Tax=Paenibacillus agricola TaxID=2716264 RepID=A0ABX0IX95_9BACL|nr:Asp23/Gls24 family envelope stress response protein [Paenibacillus agricola]NHN28442.1 Asp23/Gls24 family envelope stress response protein [Paenibacillus agricola]
MTVELDTEYGKIYVADEVIAMLAGAAALECYGLVGMATRNQFKDGIAELLKRDNSSRGVELVRVGPETAGDHQEIIINLYIIVSYGTKISVVASNVQRKVKYILNDVIGLKIETINIFVQGVRVAT